MMFLAEKFPKSCFNLSTPTRCESMGSGKGIKGDKNTGLLFVFENPSRKPDQFFYHGLPNFLIVCIFLFKCLRQLYEKLLKLDRFHEIIKGPKLHPLDAGLHRSVPGKQENFRQGLEAGPACRQCIATSVTGWVVSGRFENQPLLGESA